MKKKIFLVFMILLINSITGVAQIKKTKNFIGICPSVTVEPFYQKGELDINIVPIVFQKTISKRIDIRVSTILNYGIRNTSSQISHLGVQMSFPIFLSKKEDLLFPSEGFFISPGLGFTRNRMEKHSNVGFWLEPGYCLKISENWSIFFGVQLGATHFDYDNGTQKWGNHFGIKIVLGRWF